jgi:hypothetical protein
MAVDEANAVHMTVAWDEQARGRRRIVVAHGTVDGKNPVRLTRQPIDDQPGSYPVIAPVQDGTIVAWTSGTAEQASLRVERLPTKR